EVKSKSPERPEGAPIPAEPDEQDRQLIDNAPKGAELRAKLRNLAELNKPKAEMLPTEVNRGRKLREAETIVVKKILSCVARMRGKFGKGVVAAVLKGSKAKQVLDNHLDKLSTYGLLMEMSQEDITEFIKALIESDCLSVANS